MKQTKVRVLQGTPRQLGYSFPAEWEPHAATWFSWPRPEGISFPGKYHTVPENLIRIFCEIQSRERVEINVPNENYEFIVRQFLDEYGCPDRNVGFHYIKTNESWCRDHGPAFVVRKRKMRTKKATKRELAVVDWGFNAWGGKYPPYDDDDRVPTEVARELQVPVFYPRSGLGVSPERTPRQRSTRGRDAHATQITDLVVMEGGAVDFNGAGTVLTTTDCLLNKNRNPGLSKEQIEQYLLDYYGQRHVCWLTGGIEGDDTDGHVDDLARFIGPRKIVIGIEEDPKDANYRTLRRVRRQLDHLRDQDGRAFEVIEIPMPNPVEHDGQRLPATYVNFYFVNGALLVPTYRDRRNDRRALETLQSHLPKHKAIGIDCTELIWGLGAIHCLTQQQPKG
jgi:agmatine deiminase